MPAEPFIFDDIATDQDLKVPTHRVHSVEEVTKNQLTLDQFVVYGYPLPRDYGQISSTYNRTAEPFKISLVGDDWEWRTAVSNYVESWDFELGLPLHYFIRAPKLAPKRYRLHFARFVLPTRWGGYFSAYYSSFFYGYYIMKEGVRYYIDACEFDGAFYHEPKSWNRAGERALTIPEDWASNRFSDAFGGVE